MSSIWSPIEARSASSLVRVSVFERSPPPSTYSLASDSISEIDSAAVRAVPTVAEPSDSASSTLVRLRTSDFIVWAIAQTAPLSLAVATLRPVEISSWTFAMPLLIAFRVWRATIELALVRIEDMSVVLSWRAVPSTPPDHGWPRACGNRMNALLTAAARPSTTSRRPFDRVPATCGRWVKQG